MSQANSIGIFLVLFACFNVFLQQTLLNQTKQ